MKRFTDLPRDLFLAPPGKPPQVTFRRARAVDLAPLHRACFAERPLPQFGDGFRRSLAAQRDGQRVHLVGVHDKQPMATGQLLGYGKSVEIADLAVAPARRGEGVGTALLTVLMRIAAFKGFDSVEICVIHENLRARALYERCGFIPDRTVDLTETASVIVLRKRLSKNWQTLTIAGINHDW